jgi:hypothetical protein
MRAGVSTAIVSFAALAVVACATAPRGGCAGDGQALYRAHCAACHRLYEPSDRTRAEWTALVQRMAARAHLSVEERDALLRYLHASARDAARPGGVTY